VPTVYVQIHASTNPCDALPSRMQSNSCVLSSITHAPAPFAGDLTTNAALKGGGVTVSVDDIAVPAYDAVIVTVVDARTVDVSTRNVALRDPDATVTLAGTLAIAGLLLVVSTSAPPSGAALASVTVACGCPCPWIDDGVTDSELLPAGTGAGGAPPLAGGVGVDVDAAGGDGLVPAPVPPPHATSSGMNTVRLRIAERRYVLFRMPGG